MIIKSPCIFHLTPFIKEKIVSGCMTTSFVNSNDQLADIFTKSPRGPRINYIRDKLGAFDLYAPV